jgi:hypothetical protein
MKTYLYILIIVVSWGCNSVNKKDKENNFKHFSHVQSYLSYDCIKEEMDTVNISLILKKTPISGMGNYLITSNKYLLKVNLLYLDSTVLISRIPSHYGRNSNHITFNIYDDTTISFCNDFVKYAEIEVLDIEKIVLQYYLEKDKHLKFDVQNNDMGIDLRIYNEVNPLKCQKVIDVLANSYANVINNYCEQRFSKKYEDLNPHETIILLNEIKFETNLIVSSFESLYTY